MAYFPSYFIFINYLYKFYRNIYFFQEEDEDDECVLKGKSTSLSAFFRVARNMMSMIFKDKLAGNKRDLDKFTKLRWKFNCNYCNCSLSEISLNNITQSNEYTFNVYFL